MSKVDQVLLFWKEQDPNVGSMLLRSNAKEIAEADKNEVVSHLPDLRGKKILELAAGIGRFTDYFSSEASHVTAVDFAPQFIDAQEKRTNVALICSDAMDLTFEENSFDFVFFNWFLMYLEDDEMELLLQRIARWLKPSGELFFRESCDLKRSGTKKSGYHVNYRSLAEYDAVVKKHFTLVKEGNIKTYVYHFADPFQCYWHCQKQIF
jgi:phosphoethanolamine N-methyltransferase